MVDVPWTCYASGVHSSENLAALNVPTASSRVSRPTSMRRQSESERRDRRAAFLGAFLATDPGDGTPIETEAFCATHPDLADVSVRPRVVTTRVLVRGMLVCWTPTAPEWAEPACRCLL